MINGFSHESAVASLNFATNVRSQKQLFFSEKLGKVSKELRELSIFLICHWFTLDFRHDIVLNV